MLSGGKEMAYYFIGGLGCNVYYPQDFLTALELPIVYLDLYCREIRQEADLEEWFALQVDLTQEMTLIAHSLGADFAVYLASVFPSVKKLILLDGGFLDLEKICSLEEEITDAKLYLENTSYVSIDEAISSERKEAKHWSQNYAKAVKENFIFDEKYVPKDLKLEKVIDREYTEFAYVIHDKNHTKNTTLIKEYFNEISNFELLGRFATWNYNNMDLCMKDAFILYDKIVKNSK